MPDTDILQARVSADAYDRALARIAELEAQVADIRAMERVADLLLAQDAEDRELAVRLGAISKHTYIAWDRTRRHWAAANISMPGYGSSYYCASTPLAALRAAHIGDAEWEEE